MIRTPAELVAPPLDRPQPRIAPSPRRSRIRRLGGQLLRGWPFVAWCAAATGAAALHVGGTAQPHALALEAAVVLAVAPAVDGTVATVAVVTGQAVRAGDRIATLDSRAVEARLGLARLELERARARVVAEREELRLAQSDRGAQATARRNSWEGDGRRLRGIADGLATAQATDQAELAAFAPQIARLGALVEQRLVTADRLDELTQRRAIVEERAAARGEELARTQAELAGWAALAPPDPPTLDPAAILGPLELAQQSEAARVAELEVALARCTLVAAADGIVSAILARPGEWRAAGAPIASIVLPSSGRVEAWIGERQFGAVVVGTRARLRPRGVGGEELTGTVCSLAPLLEEMPEQLRSLPEQRLWGRRVTIAIDGGNGALAGSIHEVTFQ